ncbi:unnamed protein product [Adineta steineri]|uniref:Uncharacterized protein n=1 Tax=Adineta steineri TaxID=433720 RepID=A0A814Y450_9BILA|nr:unnamed protein product [Adineta steineri]CAF3972348.1 unnamed protein product [Adineta steineri]
MKIVIIVLLGLSLIFALIGTTTDRWYQNTLNNSNEGLWIYCQRLSSNSSSSSIINHCYKQPYFKSQSLAISGIILLFIGFVLSIVYFYKRENDRLLIYIIIVILLASTLLLIFSYLLYPRNVHLRQLGYSIYSMSISSVIVLISTALITFLAKTIQSTRTLTSFT